MEKIRNVFEMSLEDHIKTPLTPEETRLLENPGKNWEQLRKMYFKAREKAIKKSV